MTAVIPLESLSPHGTHHSYSSTLSWGSFLSFLFPLSGPTHPQEREKFQQFLLGEIGVRSPLLMTSLAFLIFLVRFITIVMEIFHSSHRDHVIEGIIAHFVRVLSSLLGFYYCYLLKYKDTNGIKINLFSLGNLILFVVSLGGGLVLITRSRSEECPKGYVSWDSLCNPFYSLKMIPLDTLFFNLSNIILFSIIFKTHELWMGLLALSLTVVSIILSFSIIGFSNFSWPIFVIIFTILAYMILIVEIHSYNYRLFQSFQRIEYTVEEKVLKTNQDTLFQLQYNELHHMIGNVAHDMNTPLQAFIMELDILSHNLNALKQQQKDQKDMIKSKSNSKDLVSQATSQQQHQQHSLMKFNDLKIEAMSHSLLSLKYVSSFMSMTINRATDYNKIRSDIPLIPDYTSTNIANILKYVEKCVLSSTIDIPIVVEPIPGNVSSIVITDKHWLLENLLSLLTNAQKYTNDGSIKIRCRLEMNISKYQEILHESNLLLGHDTPTTLIRKKPSINGQRKPLRSTSPDGFNRDYMSFSRTNEDFLLFEVEDSGSGLSPKRIKREESINSFLEQTEKLSYFQSHQSSRATETGGGTGIGLYVISKRVEALGGLFGVRNRSDLRPGCCFWFLIPYEPEINFSESEFQTGDSISKLTKSFHPIFDSIADVASSSDTQSRPNSFCLKSHSDSENDHSNSKKHLIPSGTKLPDTSSTFLHPDPEDSHTPSTNRRAVNSRSFVDTYGKKEPPLKILIVDDSILIQKTVSRALEQCGYVVDVANHGHQCLSMIRNSTSSYDVILMDIQMPQLDGIETTKLIRKYEKELNPDIPTHSTTELLNLITNDMNEKIIKREMKEHFIIGFSANSDRTTYSNAIQAGMNTFTSKPLSMEKFHMICESHGILSLRSPRTTGRS